MALILDAAVIYYGYYSIEKLSHGASTINIVFAIIEVCSVFLAIFYTREVLRHGIKFRNEDFEITFLDENNVIRYEDIESLETFMDTKASLRKNFVDRYSKLIITLKEGSIVTLELGLTTKRKLKKIEEEINKRKSDA